MNSPLCSVPLVMTERQRVEIDYRPQCRGIWLDRGELDKIIERTASDKQPMESDPRYNDRYDRHPDNDNQDRHDEYRHHKKKGFLGDLFD